jgi:hypothetical protein
MTRDKKIALFIAPFLIIGGYIAADYYAEYKVAEQAKQKKVYELSLQGTCDISKNSCLLINANLQLELSDSKGITSLKSSYPLDQVTFSYLDTARKEHRYQFSQGVDRQHWGKATKLSTLYQQVSPLKLRLIVTINTAYYFAEFLTNGQVSDNGN